MEAAIKDLSDIFSHIVAIRYRDGITQVHLLYPGDLEQVPGEAERLDSGSEKFPVEFRKTVGSVEFFVWMKANEV